MSTTQPVPLPIRAAQVIGITTSTYLLGQVTTLSTLAIPALLKAGPPLLAEQWGTMFERGKTVGIALSALPVVAFGYLATQHHTTPSFKLYLTAALAQTLIFPYTWAFIIPINTALLRKRQEGAAAAIEDKKAEVGITQEASTHALVDRWASVALGRAVLAAVGAVCGLSAALKRVEIVGIERVALASGADRMG